MDYLILAAELITDGLSRGYAGMTDAEAAVDLNTEYRERNRTSMSGSEIVNAVDVSEWTGLSDTQRRTVWDIVHMGDVNPFGVEATLLIGVFGPESTTIGNLAVVRKESISRATELGLSRVREGTVAQARAM